MFNLLPWVANLMVAIRYWQMNFHCDVLPVIMYNLASTSLLKCAIISSKYCTFGVEKIE
jgi:hypothetical protein